jgi:hypothetical protein
VYSNEKSAIVRMFYRGEDMSKNSSDDAHSKGEKDYTRSGGVASNPLTEIFHPTYNPPSGHEDEYKSGWDNAKKQDD